MSRATRYAIGLLCWVLATFLVVPAFAQINYPDFSSSVGLNLVGTAQVTANRLRLTENRMNQQGSAWYTTKQNLTNGFSTTFRFQLHGQSPEDGLGHGLGFHIQNVSTNLNVDERGTAGTVTVSFATLFSLPEGDFPNVVAVYVNGALSTYTSLFPNTININDEGVHTARIDYAGGWLTVSVDNEAVLTLAVDLAAAGVLDSSGSAWVGFSGRTVFAYENTDVLNWTLTPFTSPARTLIILGDNPYEGVSVSAPADLVGTGNGVTPFVRVYPAGTPVTLNAATFAPDGNEFEKWQIDGVDYSGDPELQITLDDNHIVTAVYESTKSVVWDTGAPKTVISNNQEVYLGYISGNYSATLPQRWSAIPFRIPPGGAVISQVDADWFVVDGYQGANVRYIIWRRTGLNRPVDGDQVAQGVLGAYSAGVNDPRIPGGEDWLHRYSNLDIFLPGGDYYLTIYSDGIGAGNTTGFSALAWLTGADLQPSEIEQDFMWRSRSFPNPGFEVYAPNSIQPKAGQDPKDRWNCAFVLYGKLAVIRGNIALGDYGGDPSLVPISVRLRKEGGGEETRTVFTNRNGDYSLWVEPGTYEVSFKASHWLRVNLTGVTLGLAEEVTGQDVSLTNGDIDGDNEVTLFDFGGLVAAFGSMPGDSNWNPDADLDGDLEVTLFDFGILVRNFGAMGDE
ncbi:MAG: lectin-like domain-containing protein [Armatimonadota bacterium]